MSQSRDVISLVMDCIEESEFRVKWAGLRLLTALARESPAEIQPGFEYVSYILWRLRDYTTTP